MPYFIDESEWLAHYGVKGMKWGQHLFGRDRRGSVGRKGGSGQTKKAPLDPEEAEFQEHRDGLRQMRLADRQEMHSELTSKLSNAAKKIDDDIAIAEADFEAAEDFMTTSFSDKNYKRYLKSCENYANSLCKSVAALLQEAEDAKAKGNQDRVKAAFDLCDINGEPLDALFRNEFQPIHQPPQLMVERIADGTFKFNGKTVQTTLFKCRKPRPDEDFETVSEAVWQLQSWFY